MKLLAFLKISVKGIIKEFPTFLLTYALYPMIIALVMGYLQEDMFVPTIDKPIFSIVIVDEDNTKESKDLISFLKSKEISKILTVNPSDNEKFNYTLRIPEGYNSSLLGEDPASIVVEAEEKASTTMGNILVHIVNKYNSEVSQNLIIKNSIENALLSEKDKQQLIEEINIILNKTYTSSAIDTNIHNVRKSLDSFEYYSLTFLNFSFIIFIMAIIVSDSLDKENGTYSRIMSTSITKFQYFNCTLISNYLMMVVINLIYVGAYRLSGLSFNGSFSILLIIVLIQSFIITLIGTLISKLFKKKYGLPMAQVFLVFQIISGSLIPLSKFNGNKVFEILSKYRPDTLMVDTYRNYLIYNDLSSISNYLLIMIGLSIVLYLFNILAINRKRGANI